MKIILTKEEKEEIDYIIKRGKEAGEHIESLEDNVKFMKELRKK